MENCYYSMSPCIHNQLRILTNTRNLVIIVLDEKRKYIVKILLSAFNGYRKSFTLREISYLLVILASITLTTQKVKHTCAILKYDILISMKFNLTTLFSSVMFKHITNSLISKCIYVKKYITKDHKTL